MSALSHETIVLEVAAWRTRNVSIILDFSFTEFPVRMIAAFFRFLGAVSRGAFLMKNF